jgi:hypothetical protein
VRAAKSAAQSKENKYQRLVSVRLEALLRASPLYEKHKARRISDLGSSFLRRTAFATCVANRACKYFDIKIFNLEIDPFS